jgi:hypothetical protein
MEQWVNKGGHVEFHLMAVDRVLIVLILSHYLKNTGTDLL